MQAQRKKHNAASRHGSSKSGRKPPLVDVFLKAFGALAFFTLHRLVTVFTGAYENALHFGAVNSAIKVQVARKTAKTC